ncbi:MAG: O-antigen ligase family protein [Rickettsiales bacterium]|nr:MAG: O-antigen ligase family protein [Rickettsiales bacterium]
MNKIFDFFLFLFPIIGLVAGLSLGITIPIFGLIILFKIRKNLIFNFQNLKLELLFFSWLFISIFWSINPSKSATSFFIIISTYILFIILIQNIETIKKNILISEKRLLYSLFAAIAVFIFELVTDGFISSYFRQTIQSKSDYQFHLYYLDRGCAFTALFAWVVIASLICTRNYVLSLITYFLVLIVLSFSDSFAGFLSFFISGIVFILTQYFPFKNSKILSVTLIFSTLIFIVLIFKINPYKTSDEADFLPISAKHRLFIWSYSANKILEKPVSGWGHGASRLFDTKDDEMIIYKNYHLHPLPTHPHNNIIQILLENGIIGLILYLILICKYLIIWGKTTEQQITNSLDKFKNIRFLRSVGYACFSTFFLISMISFNMWQSWWLCSYLWAGLMFKFFTHRIS